MTIEEYRASYPHDLVSAPLKCAGCGSNKRLNRNGVYARWCADGKETYRIRVARFLCTACWRTTSLLPDFALSYRLLCLGLVDLYFRAEAKVRVAFAHADLLKSYWKRWQRRWDGFRKKVGRYFGNFRNRDPCQGWEALGRRPGGVARVNRQLVEKFALNLLGEYAIHGQVLLRA